MGLVLEYWGLETETLVTRLFDMDFIRRSARRGRPQPEVLNDFY
mgnify:FL=1